MTRRAFRADDAGPDEPEMACDVCGLEAGLCECPECPVCGTAGDPGCLKAHIMPLVAETVEALREMVFAYVNKDADIPHSFEIEAMEKALTVFEKLPSFFDTEKTMSAESFTRTALARLKST